MTQAEVSLACEYRILEEATAEFNLNILSALKSSS
jgi:hypothetical protein